MSSAPYHLSFTAGGLLLNEAIVFVGVYLRMGGWDEAAHEVREQNLLQARTASSAVRVVREVRKRLTTLSEVLLEAFSRGVADDQRQILWIAACRRYQLLRDFGSEVIRERYLQLDLTLSYDDFDSFLEHQAVWHAEIDKLSPTTRAKLRQVTFRMLREAGILSSDNVIQAVSISQSVVRVVHKESPRDLLVFPIHESEIKRVLP